MAFGGLDFIKSSPKSAIGGIFSAFGSPKYPHRGYFFPPKEDRQLAPKGLRIGAVRPEGLLRPIRALGRAARRAPAACLPCGPKGRWNGKEKGERKKPAKKKEERERDLLIPRRECRTALRALCTAHNPSDCSPDNSLDHLHLLCTWFVRPYGPHSLTPYTGVWSVRNVHTHLMKWRWCTFRVRCRRHRTYTLCEARRAEHYE